jgi:hypothetical protein
MSDEKCVVFTAYGHNNTVDKFTIKRLSDSDAEFYCNTINGLRLEGETWVFARRISENVDYTMKDFLPQKFEILQTLDDRSIQKVLREVDSQELAKALKIADIPTQDKIFMNMSKRAAQMIKEDMEYMGPIRLSDCITAQEKILDIVRSLENSGVIQILSETEILL